jgi:hypothetical protein
MSLHSSSLTEYFAVVPMKPLFSASPYATKVSGSRRERQIARIQFRQSGLCLHRGWSNVVEIFIKSHEFRSGH